MSGRGKVILGIDPGYAILGWGVVRVGHSEPHDPTGRGISECSLKVSKNSEILRGGGESAPQNDSVEYLDHGIIQTHATEEMGQRLAQICRELTAIIKKFQPTEIAIEEVFFGKNAKTAIKVAHARGVVMMCAVEHTGRIFEYKPANIKLAIAGAGNAKKPDVQACVQEILRLAELPKQDDAADALAIALAHMRLCHCEEP